eukprot:6193498-Pleurochrysis_carterae.AAC.5
MQGSHNLHLNAPREATSFCFEYLHSDLVDISKHLRDNTSTSSWLHQTRTATQRGRKVCDLFSVLLTSPAHWTGAKQTRRPSELASVLMQLVWRAAFECRWSCPGQDSADFCRCARSIVSLRAESCRVE